MRNKKSIGLPSGPNEFLKDITQHISVEGYKRYSEDVNNPYNIIESSNITMEDVDFPVRGYGNNGVVQDMTPGVPHYDYGNADYVVEVPMAQDGREQATISSYEEPAWYEKALDRLASPMTAFGYSARNQDIPDNLPINMEERNTFDSVIDTLNPFAWIKYGAQAKRDLDESRYLDAGLNTLGAIPIVPAWLAKSKIKKGIKYADEFIDDAISNAYKYNPNAFQNINSKLPKFLQLNKAENKNWLRQVGKDAIDDVKQTGVVREIDEVINKKLFNEKLEALMNQQTGISFSLDKRYPGPFFKRGELFFDYNKKARPNSATKRNTRGKSGSADYLIETDFGGKKADWFFQPGYMQKMNIDPKPFSKIEGDIGIMKPWRRESNNFNFYKKDWWDGYKKTPLDKLQPGGETEEYKVQKGYGSNEAKGVKVDDDVVQNSFQYKWLNSPKYKEMLTNEVGPNDDAEFITNSRIGNLQNIPIILNPNTHEDEGVGATSNNATGRITFYKPSQDGLDEGYAHENTVEHEIGHSSDRVGEDTKEKYLENLSLFDKAALANYKMSNIESNTISPNYIGLANKAYNFITGNETNSLQDRGAQIEKNLSLDRLIPEKTIQRFNDERLNIEGYDQEGIPIINDYDEAYYKKYDEKGEPIVTYNNDGTIQEGSIGIDKDSWADYVSKPTEARARINTIRSAARDLGIYDPFTEKLTPEKFQELKRREHHLDRGENNSYNALMQLQDIYSDDEIFNMLNTVSDASENISNKNYAKKGSELRKGQNGNKEYKVQKGDTFYGIANRNNVSWDTLKKANPNVNIESLGLNQKIIIPKAINLSPVIEETTEVISENKPFEFNKDLLLKQTFAESSFKPGARSNVGAQGLTQFMPKTITEIKRLNLVGSDFDIHDPAQAVQAHKLYMDHLYNKEWINKENQSEEVRLAKTLAAYNRGPNAVKRILTKEKRKGKDIYNSLDWLDALPNETRDYINMILLGKNSKGRPNFQDNFIKVLNDDNYKQYIDLYQYGGEGPMLPTMADYPLVNEEEFIGPYTDDYIPKKEEYGYNPNTQKPVVNTNSYIVKSGDNLSRIANKYKTSVDELIRLNDISDPNKISINQELILPEIPENSAVDNLYKVKSGDTLGKIAKAYKTSVNKLATLNNIEDVNKININQELVIPDSYKERPFIEESWYDIDDIQKNNDRVNNLTDENIIINSQLLNNPNQSYVVIDKKTQRLKLYRGDEIGLDFEVLTGKNPGDAQTVTNVIDQNGDGIITDADKINGNFKTNWKAGNLSTGAGIYTINQSSQTSEDRYQNAPSFNLLNESGIQVGTSIHGTPTYRNSFFDDGNLENNNASYGCINGKCSDLDALYDMNLPPGTPVYILPEDEGNAFQQVDGKAVMRMSSKNRENYLQYTDVIGNEQEGQGGNYSTSTLSYKPIRAKLDEKLFKEKVYTTFDFNDDEEFNNTTQPFINALEKNKKEIMLAAQIPGDVYNQIAKIAFGVYGTESNFGDTHSMMGNLGRAGSKYFDKKGSSSPDVVSKYDTYGIQGNNNSVGYTQIRFQHTPWVDGKVLKYDENGKATYNGKIYTGQANKPVTVNELNLAEKTALEAVGITSNKDFLDPEKAAIGTAVVLGVRYNQELTTKQKEDIWKYLPSKWNNRPNYASRVKSNSRYLEFEQLDRLQKGGEVENNIMYKNYIDGVYTGSKMESKAEKVYDKLNRLHYRDAKAKQMTPANYVLSHIIG